MKRTAILATAAALIGFTTAAGAHTLRVECKKLNQTNVVCRGVFSDGEIARAMTVQLYDESDKLLATGKTDTKGEYAFKVPAPEYNVVVAASKAEVASMSSEDIW